MRLGVTAPLFLTRARYIEDSLSEAIGRGVRQYVIIGAGLDTYAFRQPAGPPLQVFELDHPSTQSLKQKRLENAGLVTPAHLHFVATALKRTRFDVGAPTLFSWAGVT